MNKTISKNEWTKLEDNLFNANHRTLMIAHHNGTVAQYVTIEQLEKEYNARSKNI